jgi:hypothetical protein
MPNVVSICGAFCEPIRTHFFFSAAPYEIMVTDGRVHDIYKDDHDRWCEYIFYRGLYRTAYARVSRGFITDTELQVGQFAVPSYGKTTGDVAEVDRYLQVAKDELPKEHVRLFFFPLSPERCEHSPPHAHPASCIVVP